MHISTHTYLSCRAGPGSSQQLLSQAQQLVQLHALGDQPVTVIIIGVNNQRMRLMGGMGLGLGLGLSLCVGW